MGYIIRPKEKFAGYTTFEQMLRETYNKKNNSTLGDVKPKLQKKDSTVTSTTTQVKNVVKNKVNHNIQEIVTEKNKRENDNGIIGKIIKKIIG